ncbi:hypothetical protein DEM28_25400, partial [Enterobacter mori]
MKRPDDEILSCVNSNKPAMALSLASPGLAFKACAGPVAAALCCEGAIKAEGDVLPCRPLRSTRLLLQNLAEPMSHVLFYESWLAGDESVKAYQIS